MGLEAALQLGWASQVGSVVKNPPANAGDAGSTPDPLEEEMATHSSILAWKIPMDRLHTVHGVTKELDMTEHTCITTRTAGIRHKPISCCVYALIY